eukprot:jgi/Mesvir1/12121/Mv00382-RA.2
MYYGDVRASESMRQRAAAATENAPQKRMVYINDTKLNENYVNNKITNTKYTLWTFLPKNFLEQFGRFMNKYFLLIACLQLWPAITPVNPASTWGPLLFIFAVSAAKEAYDDYNRHVQDDKANSRLVWVVKNNCKIRIKSQDICVGDVVWLKENDEVPCDLVVVGTSDPAGLCYVETSALDGETDLKTRSVPTSCMGLAQDQLHKLKGVIECPACDTNAHRFDGTLRLFPPFLSTQRCTLSISHTLLQACFLRNTEWACGVAVHTGNETKVGMSKGAPPTKLTAVDVIIDRISTAVFCLQLLLVVFVGGLGNHWRKSEGVQIYYLQYPSEDEWYEPVIIPLRFELLCSIMIPISLKVTMDLMKGMYAKFIEWDIRMYCPELDAPAVAANTAISEDLGQIEYILTDKTGTLTDNEMVFKKCVIGGVAYGVDTSSALSDPALLQAIASGSEVVSLFTLVMALCNSVTPTTREEQADLSYRAASPDEEALVLAAKALGTVFQERHGTQLVVHRGTKAASYELLASLDFTSERKRMSVVVRENSSGQLLLLTKGADEVIFPRLKPDQDTQPVWELLEGYGQHGLRTMVLATKRLTESMYEEWATKFKAANQSVLDREWRVAEVCNLLEQDLRLLGATAIEDKLQDGVPETIRLLRRAGVNFWMLTGDKHSTAVQVALSCNLISPPPQGHLLSVAGASVDEVGAALDRVLLTVHSPCNALKDMTFTIDGASLEIALQYHLEAFSRLSQTVHTAICCRVTPSQKARIVALVKSHGRRTLAIGDGGNDVGMIRAAHVGVGISGKEGLQAARAADYCIARFRFLSRLLLVHGRYSYLRSSLIAQYSFYKSLVVCFIQLLFSSKSGVSGSSLFNSFSLMAYNVIYTGLPIMTYCLNKDISEEAVFRHPHVLHACQRGAALNATSFLLWALRALYQAVVIFYMTLWLASDSISDLHSLSLVAFTACIIVQTLTVATETHSFTLLQHAGIWGTLALFFGLNLFVSTLVWGGMYYIMARLLVSPAYWLTVIAVSVAALLPPLLARCMRQLYAPTLVYLIRRAEHAESLFGSGVVTTASNPIADPDIDADILESGGFADNMARFNPSDGSQSGAGAEGATTTSSTGKSVEDVLDPMGRLAIGPNAVTMMMAMQPEITPSRESLYAPLLYGAVPRRKDSGAAGAGADGAGSSSGSWGSSKSGGLLPGIKTGAGGGG